MKRKNIVTGVALLLLATPGFAFSNFSANAGPTTYPVEIAAGGDGGCPTSTGGLSITHNPNATAMTIQCGQPNGFAMGSKLDTPDTASSSLVDDGTDVSLGWTPGAKNSSNGYKLGLGLKIGDRSVKNTPLDFYDADAAVDSSFAPSSIANSKRQNLNLRLARVPALQPGIARCAVDGESEAITWDAETGLLAATKGVRKYTPKVIINCAQGPKGDPGSNGLKGDKGDSGAPGTAAVKLYVSQLSPTGTSMTNVSGSNKQMTASVLCPVGQTQPVSGGYDLSKSTTSTWPQVVASYPTATGWTVVVNVPSQNSSAAQAVLSAYVVCQ